MSFWTLPEHGNYTDGTLIGEAMAKAYTANLSRQSILPPTLPQIVLDIAGVGAANLSEARHGQLVGFFSALEEVLRSVGV